MHETISWLQKLSNRIYAIPAVAQWWARRAAQRSAALDGEDDAMPFARLHKPLSAARGVLITTGGVHLTEQAPFDMETPQGDPAYREIPVNVAPEHITITHNYYDHRDADADLNVIFPLAHFQELVQQKIIGSLAPRHYGFMGHIDGELVTTLTQRIAPEVAAKLRADGVDFALLTPA
jgi:D-proline reductase (dithiol) PrdB